MVGFAFDERSERAQLILVGAVAIAFIVLGLAVVFNTVLYTENVASTGAASAPRDAQIVKDEVELGVKELIARTNMKGNWQGDNEARDGAFRNVSAYSDGMLQVQGRSGEVLVSFEVQDTTRGGDDEIGAAIQHENGQFVDASVASNENWKVVDSGAEPFGDFTMTVAGSTLASEGSDEMFRAVWNESNSENNYTVWIYEESGGDVAIRTVNSSGSQNPVKLNHFSSAGECILEDTGGPSDRVEFRFSEGRIVGHPECSGQLDVSHAIPSDEPRTLSFHRGESITGDYELVVDDPSKVGSGVTDGNSLTPPLLASDTPYWTYAVWEIVLQVRYESGETSFTDEYDVEVYNRSR